MIAVRRAGVHLVVRILVVAVAGGISGASQAADKPPLNPDVSAPAVVPSAISATVEFSLSALRQELERSIPKRLVTFRDRTQSCWHRPLLGQMININCEYSGFVERTGPITLRAEGDRLVAGLPLNGLVSARGARGLLGLIQGTGQGQMNVSVAATPRLRPDWSVALDLAEGFRWREAPTVDVLRFSINVTRFVEPQIRKQLARVQGDVAARVRKLDLRSKAEQAWRHAFETVKLSDDPPIWLKAKPQGVAFSGLQSQGDVLEGAIEIRGTAETIVGPEPAAQVATPLPRLSADVPDRSRFEVLVPVLINYPAVAQTFRDALSSRLQAGGITVKDVSVYPSQGKVVAAVRFSGADAAADAEKVIYLAATTQFDGGDVAFDDLAEAAGLADALPAPLAALLSDPEKRKSLFADLRLKYRDKRDQLMAAIDSKLNRRLPDGFRSEGHLTSVAPEKLVLGQDALRVDLLASGSLKLLYGL